MFRTRSLLPAIAGLLIALAIPAAAQQDYPNRPIRLIIPFPPGGSNDIVGRAIATQLSEKLGKQVIVDKHNHGCCQRLPVSERGQAQPRTQCAAQHQRQMGNGCEHARKQQHIQVKLAHHRMQLYNRSAGKKTLGKAPRQQPCAHAG